jgi:hypothetical protein
MAAATTRRSLSTVAFPPATHAPTSAALVSLPAPSPTPPAPPTRRVREVVSAAPGAVLLLNDWVSFAIAHDHVTTIADVADVRGDARVCTDPMSIHGFDELIPVRTHTVVSLCTHTLITAMESSLWNTL